MATRKWGTEHLVNTTTTGDQRGARVAVLASGGFVVVWEDRSGAFAAIRAQRFDATGKKLGGELAIAVQPGNNEVHPAVAAIAGGGFYVTWTQQVGTSNYILGSMFDGNGVFVRNAPAVFDSVQIDSSAIAPLDTGAVVVWQHPGPTGGLHAPGMDVNLRFMKPDGTGGAVLQSNVSTDGDQVQPAVAADPSGEVLAVVWSDQRTGKIDGHFYLSDGFSEPTFTAYAISPLPSNNTLSNPAIVWLDFQTFVVSWSILQPNKNGTSFNVSDVEARVFQWSGPGGVIPLTDPIKVNRTAIFFHETPKLTALPGGGFAVAWQDYNYDATSLDNDGSIHLQAFDGDYRKTGGEIMVNTTTSGVQGDPSIAALADGRVVVTWTDASATGADATGTGVRMQIVDPREGMVIGTTGDDVLYGHDQVNDEITAGAGKDALYGLGGDDTLYGGEGNDVLVGGAGADLMVGGVGDDTYYVSSPDDTVVEEPSEGTDTVYASVSYALAAGTSVEFLRANAGTTGLSLTGNEFNNTLVSGVGNETLNGGNGNDVLVGGTGADVLTGGAGADVFRFSALADSTVAVGGRDTIMDFVSGDKIDLHLVDANASLPGDQAFSFIGANAFSGTAGQLRYALSGGNTLITGDVNGNKAADFSILVSGAHAFSGSEFVR